MERIVRDEVIKVRLSKPEKKELVLSLPPKSNVSSFTRGLIKNAINMRSNPLERELAMTKQRLDENLAKGESVELDRKVLCKLVEELTSKIFEKKQKAGEDAE